MNIGAKIREEREIRGLSQKQLADKIGVVQNTLSRYENNSVQPSLKVLISIADVFEVSLDYLVGRNGY